MPDEDKNFLKILAALGEYRSLLCLSGTLPEREFFTRFRLPVIAADGAFNLLRQMDIGTDVIVGDWDSVREPVPETVRKVIVEDQSFSDFQKALVFARENHLLPTIVLGVNGGYMDHILNNIGILSQTDSIAYMPPTVGLMLRRPVALDLPPETKLSLFGMPRGRIRTEGLRWELEGQILEFAGYNSCFNRSIGERVTFDVTDGRIFLLIYLNEVGDRGGGIVSSLLKF
jgi:thiamine pyrophosphokinase